MELAFVHIVDAGVFLNHFRALVKTSNNEIASEKILDIARDIVSVIVKASSNILVRILDIESFRETESINNLVAPLFRISDREKDSENPRLIPLLIVSVTDMVSSATPSQTRDTTRLLSKSITSFKDKSITGARKKFIV
jgi:hypothetical protein